MSLGQVTASPKHESVATIKLRAAAARTAGTVVRISTGHTSGVCTDVSLADDTNVYRVAVVLQTVASGEVYEAAVEGTVTVTVPNGTYVVGNGLDIFDGAVRPSGAAAEARSGVSTLNDFAIVAALPNGGTNPGSVVATLYGDPITAQT